MDKPSGLFGGGLLFGNISSINVNEKSCPIRYLEHVVVGVKIIHPRRGAIQISLNSPMGTNSMLLGSRKKDYVSLTKNDLADLGFGARFSTDENFRVTKILALKGRMIMDGK